MGHVFMAEKRIVHGEIRLGNVWQYGQLEHGKCSGTVAFD
jgi:hypothetical protein